MILPISLWFICLWTLDLIIPCGPAVTTSCRGGWIYDASSFKTACYTPRKVPLYFMINKSHIKGDRVQRDTRNIDNFHSWSGALEKWLLIREIITNAILNNVLWEKRALANLLLWCLNHLYRCIVFYLPITLILLPYTTRLHALLGDTYLSFWPYFM